LPPNCACPTNRKQWSRGLALYGHAPGGATQTNRFRP
jgi:hypothetical protein